MRPNDRQYLKSHEWCKIDGNVATIGISDYAVSHLSDLVFLDLPNKGSNVTAGESFGEIESVAPVLGRDVPAGRPPRSIGFEQIAQCREVVDSAL